jgi:hypothetical protein
MRRMPRPRLPLSSVCSYVRVQPALHALQPGYQTAELPAVCMPCIQRDSAVVPNGEVRSCT